MSTTAYIAFCLLLALAIIGWMMFFWTAVMGGARIHRMEAVIRKCQNTMAKTAAALEHRGDHELHDVVRGLWQGVETIETWRADDGGE